MTDCPECGEAALRKLISAPNFRLKGSGWYETDFKKDNQKNLAGDREGSASKDGGDSASKGSDSKGADSGKSESSSSSGTKSSKKDGDNSGKAA